MIHDQTNIAGEYSLAMASLGHRYLATNYYVRTSSSHYQLDDWVPGVCMCGWVGALARPPVDRRASPGGLPTAAT